MSAPTIRGGTGDGVVLALTDVVKEYAGAPPVRALDGVSFAVESGEMVAVVGPSGSGKSTLLHLIGALDRPSSGTVRVAGADIGELSDRELSALRAWRVGFVFQQFHLLDGLTAWMERKGFAAVDQFRGILALPPGMDEAAHERAGYVSAMQAANSSVRSLVTARASPATPRRRRRGDRPAIPRLPPAARP